MKQRPPINQSINNDSTLNNKNHSTYSVRWKMHPDVTLTSNLTWECLPRLKWCLKVLGATGNMQKTLEIDNPHFKLFSPESLSGSSQIKCI